MDRKTKEMYSEVYSILKLLDEKYVKKLPVKLYDLIEKNRLEDYNPIYNPSESLLNQNIKRETLAMLALFELKYWLETDEEKNEFKACLKRNSEEKSRKMRERYSSENIFKQLNEAREGSQVVENDIEKVVEDTEKINENKKSLFQKIFRKNK